MPFIVQCPHSDCRKFLLLEDASRGGTAHCLLCKKPIQIEAATPPKADAVKKSGPREG